MSVSPTYPSGADVAFVPCEGGPAVEFLRIPRVRAGGRKLSRARLRKKREKAIKAAMRPTRWVQILAVPLASISGSDPEANAMTPAGLVSHAQRATWRSGPRSTRCLEELPQGDPCPSPGPAKDAAVRAFIFKEPL